MADVKFIRKGGRIIPIRAAGKAALKSARPVAAAGAALSIRKNIKKFKANPSQKAKIKVNAGLDALGLGLSIASGAIGAATFSSGAKGFLGGMLGGHALDVAGIGANVASVSGKGHTKERLTQAARQEARNFAIGNAVYAAGIIGIKKNREKVIEYASKFIQFGKKALVGV